MITRLEEALGAELICPQPMTWASNTYELAGAAGICPNEHNFDFFSVLRRQKAEHLVFRSMVFRLLAQSDALGTFYSVSLRL